LLHPHRVVIIRHTKIQGDANPGLSGFPKGFSTYEYAVLTIW